MALTANTLTTDEQQQAARELRTARVSADQRQTAGAAARQTNAAPTSSAVVASAALEAAIPNKTRWQWAQEAAEDLAPETFFLSGIAALGLYVMRWIGGNAMHSKSIPGYSLGDFGDYVRHMKFMLLVMFVIVVVGSVWAIFYLISKTPFSAIVPWTALLKVFSLFGH